MNYQQLHTIADAIGQRDYPAAAAAIDDALELEGGPAWHKSLGQLRAFLLSDFMSPFSGIFSWGNGKLPFLAFSVLPGVSCPGAGPCLDWCYSFKAWRYPAAFARMAQNLVLVRENTPLIAAALDDAIAGHDQVDFRLYVDGDIDSVETAQFWFDALQARPALRAYGYSKSLEVLLSPGVTMPGNYQLNLSSGHKYDDATAERVRSLPGYRGDFLAVPIGRKVRAAEHGTREVNQELRQAHGRKAFTCPGACGDCTPTGHACGSARFKNVDIIIACH